MAVTIGSGLGGFAAVVPQPTYGASFVTPTRTLTFMSGTATWDPHWVQGTPYLRGGQIVDQGSAFVQTWLDAKGTIQGDATTTGFALLLAASLGSAGTLTQVGTTAAYRLGGSSGISLGAPEQGIGAGSACCFDMQWGVPTADGTQQPVNFHSCIVQKAEFVFDRTGLVTWSIDFDAQYVEKSTAIITPSFPAAPTPFSMANASSFFKLGTYNSETAVDGIRKATITLTRAMDVGRIYLGNTYKDVPVTNGIVDIDVALDADYTTAAKTALFDLFLAGTSTSLFVEAVGAAIGSSGVNNYFGIQVPDLFVNTGGETNLDGADLVKNTVNLVGKIDAANDPSVKAFLATADTTF